MKQHEYDRPNWWYRVQTARLARMIEETKEMTEEARRLIERESTREHGDQ
jgi:NTP pyrophosphatase (non-canonical NTP hydrolase)